MEGALNKFHGNKTSIAIVNISVLLVSVFILSLVISSAPARLSFAGIFLGEWIFLSTFPMFFLLRSIVFKMLFTERDPFLCGVLIFFTYCLAIHFVPDIWTALSNGRKIDRILRHSALFILPAIWILQGVSIGSIWNSKVLSYFTGTVVALSGLTAAWGAPIGNIALGPIFIFFLPQSVWQLFQRNFKAAPFSIGVLTCFMFGTASGTLFLQRTTFLNGIICLCTGVVWLGLLNSWKFKKIILLTFMAAIFYFVIGWKVSYLNSLKNNLNNALSEESLNQQIEVKDDIRMKILGGLQHPDDVALRDGKVTFFESRFRKELWGVSYDDWKVSPWLGRGFSVEVPSMFFGSPNAAASNNPKGYSILPLSGPHNSYLNLLARLGIVGIVLWFLFVLAWGVRVIGRLEIRPNLWPELVCLLALWNMASYSLFHLGLEGPHYAIPLYFLMGALYGRASKIII